MTNKGSRKTVMLAVGTVVFLWGGCTSPPAESQSGAVSISLGGAPTDVACLEVTAVGARTVTRLFAIAPGADVVLSMQGLPLGEVQFSAMAFASACDALDRAAPTFTGDPVTVTLRLGEVVPVTLILRRPGQAAVTIDFQDIPDAGGACPTGSHDGGDGTCLPSGSCSSGFHIVSDGRCHPILFSDDFQNGVLPDGWSLWLFTFFESGGRLNVGAGPRPGFNYGHSANGRGAEVAIHVGDPSWTDYRVDMDLAIAAPGAFDPYALSPCFHNASILFRTVDLAESWNDPASTTYYVATTPNDCGVHQGRIELASAHDSYIPGTGYSDARAGSSRYLLDINGVALIDGPNHYAIEVVGHRTKLWVNDTLVFDYVDDQVPLAPGATPVDHGGIGVHWAYEDTGWIDNVVVTDLR